MCVFVYAHVCASVCSRVCVYMDVCMCVHVLMGVKVLQPTPEGQPYRPESKYAKITQL